MKEGVITALSSIPQTAFVNIAVAIVTLIFGSVLIILLLSGRATVKNEAVTAAALPGKINREQRGITGLETAIVLIAFVMVGTVFAYVVLSSGLYSSQKAKEAVNAGLAQTRSTLELKGDVLASMDTLTNTCTSISFTLGTVPGGDGIDLTDTTDGRNKVVISYSDQYQSLRNVDWEVTRLTGSAGDNMLQSGDLMQVDVDLTEVNAAAADGQTVGAYTKFVLEIVPPDGAVLTIERTMPAQSTALVHLY